MPKDANFSHGQSLAGKLLSSVPTCSIVAALGSFAEENEFYPTSVAFECVDKFV